MTEQGGTTRQPDETTGAREEQHGPEMDDAQVAAHEELAQQLPPVSPPQAG